MNTVNFDDLLNHKATKPHTFLLGAGASLAAFPEGDKHGNKLPLMTNLLTVTGLGNILKKHINLDNYPTHNFELFYSRIVKEDSSISKHIDDHLRKYFYHMELPDKPTLYDYLVLSLRDKDIIATFNWDPFLLQAIRRNQHFTKMPNIVFLHGCVSVGFDSTNNAAGPLYSCSSKGGVFKPVPLMYPIDQKNYQQHHFIQSEWKKLEKYLTNSLIFTIFGYSAPESDIEAKRLIQSAWGTPEDRCLEEIEIIDIQNEEELGRKWAPLIHTHHYKVNNNFLNTFAGTYPRRSCEAFCHQNFGAMYLNEHMRIVQHNTLDDMWRWFDPIIQQEL